MRTERVDLPHLGEARDEHIGQQRMRPERLRGVHVLIGLGGSGDVDTGVETARQQERDDDRALIGGHRGGDIGDGGLFHIHERGLHHGFRQQLGDVIDEGGDDGTPLREAGPVGARDQHGRIDLAHATESTSSR